MRPLTDTQSHVLANIHRVEPWPRKIATANQSPRFQLDDKDCTQQITSLVVLKLVRHVPGDGLARV